VIDRALPPCPVEGVFIGALSGGADPALNLFDFHACYVLSSSEQSVKNFFLFFSEQTGWETTETSMNNH